MKYTTRYCRGRCCRGPLLLPFPNQGDECDLHIVTHECLGSVHRRQTCLSLILLHTVGTSSNASALYHHFHLFYGIYDHHKSALSLLCHPRKWIHDSLPHRPGKKKNPRNDVEHGTNPHSSPPPPQKKKRPSHVSTQLCCLMAYDWRKSYLKKEKSDIFGGKVPRQ